MTSELSKIKQPTPSVSTNNIQTTEIDGKKYKLIPATNSETVKPAYLSKTPLRDWVEINKKENPKVVYKEKPKKYKLPFIHTLASISIIGCGIASVVKLLKK
jgi:hypothetical protein